MKAKREWKDDLGRTIREYDCDVACVVLTTGVEVEVDSPADREDRLWTMPMDQLRAIAVGS